ncbi:MAG: type II toxin-antitoxin system RelE/ParE family toxin [Chloroflexi bacterium]|nr:type II toxin-antitoxin system RelE/ParE family toxin [Chloroflexota bacterium]
MVLSSNFQIAETQTFQKKIASGAYKQYYSRIKDNIYPALRNNPFFGANIKRLKGELNSVFRYRIGNYRVFYTINSEKKLIFILDIAHRKDAYR